MNTTLLVRTTLTPKELSNILNTHTKINYIFFYADGVNAIHHKNWPQQQNLHICRTALLRRNLIKEDESLAKPWQLSSLYDFYTHLANSKTFLIINEQGQNLQNIQPTNKLKLLFILNKINEYKYPEELMELIIGASLNFEVHVYLKDKTAMNTHPWDKHLSALPHYDIHIDEHCDQKEFSYLIDCY